jgi:hypothetical protein
MRRSRWLGGSTSGEVGGPTNSTCTEGEGSSTSGEAGHSTSGTGSEGARVHRETTLKIKWGGEASQDYVEESG